MRPDDGRPAVCGNGYHLAFHAVDAAAVRDFHAAGLAAGGSDEGSPGLRPRYSADYYGAYLRDPDGNKLQAVTYGNGRKAGPGGLEISHMTLGCSDLERAAAFYRAALAPLGLSRLPEEETAGEDAAFGHAGCALPVVYAQKPFDGRPPSAPHGSYPVLLAPDRAAVEAFQAAGSQAGGHRLAAPSQLSKALCPGGFSAGLTDPNGNILYALCPSAA